MEKKKGITLISLVITIIVLLLLAGITLTFTLGSGGLIERSKASKVDSRYATILDRIKIRESSLEMAFAKGEHGESAEDFINSLAAEGLITSEDAYDLINFKTISLGLQSDGTYKYVIDVVEGTEEGKRIYDSIKRLPNADELGNEYLKNMTLLVRTTTANEEVTLPLRNGSGLKINWNSASNPSNFQNPVPTSSPKNIYSTPGTYEVQIQGNASSIASFGESSMLYVYSNPNLVGIKHWGENGFTKINSFGGNLEGTIPLPSRNSFINLVNFGGVFHKSEGLEGNIPRELFANAPNLKAVDYSFSQCSSLTGEIPGELFMNCPELDRADKTFISCSGLTGKIPSDLFCKNPKMTNFSSLFHNCSGLTGNIPRDLFKNSTEADNLDSIFYGCRGLTGSIPGSLFSTCTKATSISLAFAFCENLTGTIPANLFANNINVKFFYSTFSGCTGLTRIPATLFDNTNLVTDFRTTFLNCTNLTGDAPALWLKTVSNTSGCFRNCTKLSNYSSIPSAWR